MLGEKNDLYTNKFWFNEFNNVIGFSEVGKEYVWKKKLSNMNIAIEGE